MRVLVCGSRTWDDNANDNLLISVLDGLWSEATVGHMTAELSKFAVIEGGAKGADEWASWWATHSPMHSHNEHPDDPVFEHETYYANWPEDGRAGGPIRNQRMLDEGKPDLVLAFVDKPLTESRGTADMVRRARKAGVTTYVIEKVA